MRSHDLVGSSSEWLSRQPPSRPTRRRRHAPSALASRRAAENPTRGTSATAMAGKTVQPESAGLFWMGTRGVPSRRRACLVGRLAIDWGFRMNVLRWACLASVVLSASAAAAARSMPAGATLILELVRATNPSLVGQDVVGADLNSLPPSTVQAAAQQVVTKLQARGFISSSLAGTLQSSMDGSVDRGTWAMFMGQFLGGGPNNAGSAATAIRWLRGHGFAVALNGQSPEAMTYLLLTNPNDAPWLDAVYDAPASPIRPSDKVTLCHNGHTIVVAKPAVQAHLNQGDTIGACG